MSGNRAGESVDGLTHYYLSLQQQAFRAHAQKDRAEVGQLTDRQSGFTRRLLQQRVINDAF